MAILADRRHHNAFLAADSIANHHRSRQVRHREEGARLGKEERQHDEVRDQLKSPTCPAIPNRPQCRLPVHMIAISTMNNSATGKISGCAVRCAVSPGQAERSMLQRGSAQLSTRRENAIRAAQFQAWTSGKIGETAGGIRFVSAHHEVNSVHA